MIDDDQSFIWPIAPAIGQLIYLCIGIALFLACCHFQRCRSYYGRPWPKFNRFVQIFDVVRLISLIQTRGCSGLAQFDCCVALEHLSWSSRILRKHCVSSRGKVSQVGFWIFNPIQQSPRNNFPRYIITARVNSMQKQWKKWCNQDIHPDNQDVYWLWQSFRMWKSLCRNRNT